MSPVGIPPHLPQQLIRFATPAALTKDRLAFKTVFGIPILPPGVTDPRKATHAYRLRHKRQEYYSKKLPLWDELSVIPKKEALPIAHGEDFEFFEKLPIGKLMMPLSITSVRTVRCMGLNYVKHAKESNLPLPEYPIVFYKPATALAGPTDPILVPPHAHIPGLDYEVELVVIIGKKGKDIPIEKVDEHIMGYTVGNDISHREWQIKRGGGQWSMGKGYDNWAPIGPSIIPKLTGKERMWTKVNGEIRQDELVADFVFGVKETVSYISRGTTLMKGDLIFMGTPSGVGMGKTPPLWLKDGDVVECGIDGIGSIRNKVSFFAQAERQKADRDEDTEGESEEEGDIKAKL